MLFCCDAGNDADRPRLAIALGVDHGAMGMENMGRLCERYARCEKPG